ncbi:hypothetical protein VOLCADRAFT_107849 [Volvox carteri f. nagariensis]|uniref:Uncharacterized protein n=1 Tax=Volvox carteri f. nagariensis TaxID=3068 RepID=D8UGU7_VOLCA|nr:uncharacterized protein VOLCADRAFT_107849 [Volvox carteri f. nagariensis]EFJ41043.1 hypothetical protein VOLCADRAFT_107849 [Volvox carteri f. nagariensis]|eukprot:XP_002957907.1 hypothetical protein VOLCADRAFT_107849 [Volvox carteri f. nagariensis]
MFVAFCSLLRRYRHGNVRQHLTGGALQSAADCVKVDFSDYHGTDESASSVRAASSAAASTSFASFHSGIHTTAITSDNDYIIFGRTARHASTASEGHTARRREILRDAAQKVSPNSSWLLAYSHNIDPRQLTFRLGKRSTLHALQEGWTLYQHKFDTVAMAALLRRIRVAQCYDADFNSAAAQSLLDAMVPRLKSITLRFGKLRDTIAYLHALAKLRSPPPQAPAKGVAGLRESEFDNSAEGTVPTGAVKDGKALLGQPAELVLDLAMWATRDRTLVLQASPRRLATLLWALLRTVPQELYSSEKLQMVLDRVAYCSIRQWPNFAPEDMRIYAVAYATFGPQGAPAAASAEKGGPGGSWRRSGRSWLGSVSSWPQMPRKKSKAEGDSGDGDADPGTAKAEGSDDNIGISINRSKYDAEAKAAQRRKRNALILQVLADQLAKRVGDVLVASPQTRDLALAAHAWALQGAPKPHMPLLVKAADAAAATPRSLLPVELVLLVEALAKYGVRQPVFLDTVRQRTRGWAAGARDVASGPAAAEESAAAEPAEQLQLQQLHGRLVGAFGSLGVTL